MILVTGATGFLGSYVIPRLAQEAAPSEITCLVPKEETVRMAGGKMREEDLIEGYKKLGVQAQSYPAQGTLKDYQESLANIRSVSAVIYMAANNNQSLPYPILYRDNAIVLANFIDALGPALRNARFVLTSSIMAQTAEEFEKKYGKATAEKLMPYGMSKRGSEQAALDRAEKYGFKPIILRLASLYGERSSAGLLKSVEALAGLAGLVPIPYFPGRASVVHAPDVAELTAKSAVNDLLPGTYGVDDCSPLAVGELIRLCAEKKGKRVRQIEIPRFFQNAILYFSHAGILLKSGAALKLSALLSDLYITQDQRIWKMAGKTPVRYGDVFPPVHETLAQARPSQARKVALLGATGFIGKEILRDCLSRGMSVRCGAHRKKFLIAGAKNVECVPCDTRDLDSLSRLLEGQEAVIDASGLTTAHGARSAADYHTVNEQGVKNLVEACRRTGVRRLVFLGSEAAHEKATGAYGRSKLAGEKIVQNSDLVWTVLKPGQVIGKEGLVNVLYALSERLPVLPVPGGTCENLELVGVREVAKFAVDAAFDANGTWERKIVFLGSEERLSLMGLLQKLWKINGKSPAVIPLPRWILSLGANFFAEIGISIPLTPDILENLYTPLPDLPQDPGVLRALNEKPEAVLKKYL